MRKRKIEEYVFVFFFFFVFLKTCFADPVNKKLIKEILTLFLSHQQQQIVHKREIHAAEIIQVNH